MTAILDQEDVWDSVFHACSWPAYFHQSHAQQCWPDPEATRQRAFGSYERALAERSCRTSARLEAMTEPLRTAIAAA